MNGSILLSILILAGFSPVIAHAQVYSYDVDMLCPEELLGSHLGFSQTRDWIHICPINEPATSFPPSDPTPEEPDVDNECLLDNDNDSINNCDDVCPDDAEDYNGILDSDGCPDDLTELIPILDFNILFQAFGNSITTTPNSFIQNQQLAIQWNTPEDIIIQSVTNTNSPFTFIYEPLPTGKLGSGLPLSQNQIRYDVNVPSKICGQAITNDCVQLVRYEIPTRVTAVINGTTVADDTHIIIDLSDDPFDENLLLLFLLLLIPLIGILFRRRKKKQRKHRVRTFLD